MQSNGKEIYHLFNISQGVRQGGILSADLYKVYLNPLWNNLNNSGIGATIGDIMCNICACADDVTVNATNEEDAQILLDIAADFAKQERYELQPAKTNLIRIKPTSHTKYNLANQTLQPNGADIPDATEATHIGLLQTDNLSAEANVDNNIKKARRATYGQWIAWT